MVWIKPILLILAMFLTQEPEWTFRFKKDGVKVSTREVAGSDFHAFIGECIFPFPAETIATAIQDIANYPLWCYQTSSTEIFKKETDRIYYRAVTLTPPLIKHREAYACNEKIPTDEHGEIMIVIKSIESKKPVPDGFIRMPYSRGLWRMLPLTPNTTLVQFEMEADPGGYIPAWLANRSSVDAPWHTMKSLQEFLQKNQH
ncbi:MAG: hypothetical protein JXR22_00160 [Prolixibacteraceae bacterium]|nr:hypothetical protein [Prolixibacteraceae bacterium]